MNQPTMLFINLTEDEKKRIAKQIEEGKRPQRWDTVGHPDQEVWSQLLASHPDAGIAVSI